MAQVTINANRSVLIEQESPTTNFDSAPQIDVGEINSAAQLRRGFIGFSLSVIPSGSEITAVTFKVYNTGTDLTDNARTLKIYRVRRAWTETTVTWNTTDGSTNWGTAGCGNTTTDREATEVATISCTNPPSTGYQTASILSTKIQEWLDGDFVNNGLVLIMDTETDDMQRFDGSGESNPPQLVIDYTPASERQGYAYYM